MTTFKKITFHNVPFIKNDKSMSFRDIHLRVPHYVSWPDALDNLEIVRQKCSRCTRKGLLKKPCATEEDIDKIAEHFQHFFTEKKHSTFSSPSSIVHQ